MITPEKYFNHAMGLTYTGAPQEEELRSALSRAYYSLYHETWNVLKREYPLELADSILEQMNKRKACDPKYAFDEKEVRKLEQDYIASMQISLHGRLKDTLRRIGIRGRLRRMYNSTNAARNRADYDFSTAFYQEDVQARLLKARELINEIREIKNPSRPALPSV